MCLGNKAVDVLQSSAVFVLLGTEKAGYGANRNYIKLLLSIYLCNVALVVESHNVGPA